MTKHGAFVLSAFVSNALLVRCQAASLTTSFPASTTASKPNSLSNLVPAIFSAVSLGTQASGTTGPVDEATESSASSVSVNVSLIMSAFSQSTAATAPSTSDPSTAAVDGESTSALSQGAAVTDPPPVQSELSTSLQALSQVASTQATATQTDNNIYYLPDLWSAPTPAVTCQPPCNIVLPPFTLATPTTLSFEPLTTVLTEKWSRGSELLTKTTSTVLTFAPVTTSIIPWFNLNITAGGGSQYSLTPSIFPVVTGSIAPPPEVSTASALNFTITSFPPNPESTDEASIVPFPIIEGEPPSLDLAIGPPPPLGVCLTDCVGGGLEGGLGLGCLVFCNSCGLTCGGGGSSGVSPPNQCVGSGCHPPGEGSQGSDETPPPEDEAPHTEPETSTGGPTATSATSDLSVSSSTSSGCERTVTVSDCQVTCTDTVTSGSVASQSSCYTGGCGSRVTGCSGEVTGTTTTTRTTASDNACPYRPPMTQWWTAEDQPVPTMPPFDEIDWIWSPMPGWSTLPPGHPALLTEGAATGTVSATTDAGSATSSASSANLSRLFSVLFSVSTANTAPQPTTNPVFAAPSSSTLPSTANADPPAATTTSQLGTITDPPQAPTETTANPPVATTAREYNKCLAAIGASNCKPEQTQCLVDQCKADENCRAANWDCEYYGTVALRMQTAR